jgi:hypothetical protein
MARQKRTPEAQVVTYFRTAPSPEARMLFGIVQDIMRERFPTVAKRPKASKAPAPAQ